MKLLTQELRQQLPALYATESQGLDALARVKFFVPWGYWTWYASEFDGEDLFFGLVAGDFVELGYFSLSELKAIRGPWGLRVERDLHFKLASLRELEAKHQKPRSTSSLS